VARPPRGLIAAEIALACVLLVGTGLVLRTLTTLLAWSPGFERERLSVAWTSLSQDTHPNRERVIAAYRGLLESAREAPGVASAGLVSGGPLFGGREVGEFVSAASAAGADTITAQWYDASPGYFGTMGLRLVAGRDLSETDTPTSPRVAIVNETFAHRLLRPGGEIGSPVVRRSDGTTFTVVGVVADVPPLNPDALTEPEIYWSQGQEPRWGAYLVVRARIDDPTLGTVLQARLGALEPGFTMNRLTSYRDRFGRQLISPRFNVILLGTFGLSALALALAGVYGLLSYSVAAGARDAAIRVALGGTEAQVVRRSLLRGLTPVGLGLVVGLAGATAVTRLMRGVVQGVPSLDPATYGGVAAVVGVTALLAAWFPTRRIGRMNTMEVLRSE
ncbi:MAG: hypothetical protein HOP28_12305, partial [Gemmatimonadales bacterium]|nr:hypothetical protein [Gemmatimonadales bacterium]